MSQLLEGYVSVELFGQTDATDKAASPPAYKFIGLARRRSPVARRKKRALSQFVGRQQELATLHALLARAESGQGQVVGIVGEAGLGKSRLLDEFRQSLQGKHVTYLEGRCLSYGQHTPYLPVLDLLRHTCGLTDAESPAAITTKVRLMLQEVGMDPEVGAPLLLHLLGVQAGPERLALHSPEALKTRTVATLQQLILNRSRQRPLILAVEDLHWIDATSEECLVSLVDRLANAPIILLASYRPGYRPPWVDKSYATQLALPRLTRHESQSVVQSTLHTAPIAETLFQTVLEKGQGNPFFLEELARTLVERGDDGPTLAVPDTVQAVLAARIDRLTPEERHLLQTAAVIGMDVPGSLLHAIAEWPDAPLRHGLAQLQAAEFLDETQRFPEVDYRFKHALTQQVAYETLLQERRRVLHARLVETLEALPPERAAEQVDRLAHHALRGEVWGKAVTYCQQAGARAHDRGAFGEAVAYFHQALQALAHLPEPGDTRVLAIRLRRALGVSLCALGECGRWLAVLGEAETLARALDDRGQLGWVLAQMAAARRMTGDLDGAIAAGQEALALAVGLGESALQVRARYSLGMACQGVGDFGRAADLLRRNVEAADRGSGAPSTDMRIRSQAWLARALGGLGAFDEGRRHGEEALRLATTEGRGDAPIIAHACLGRLYLAQGDLEPAIRVLEQGLALCRASGDLTYTRAMASGLGTALALQGRLAEGGVLLEEAITGGFRAGALHGQAHRLAWLSEVCRLVGRIEDAWQYARQALDLARQYRERANEALALHQLGVVYAHADPPDVEQAEAHYRQALALAEELGMRPLQAHCHHGLGQLYHQTGRDAQARTTLTTAIDLYRAMEMTFWLPQAEARLAEMEG
jgi:predicted ATPase